MSDLISFDDEAEGKAVVVEWAQVQNPGITTQVFLATALEGLVSAQLSANTRRAYRQDAQQFVNWLSEQERALHQLTLAEMRGYRRFLSDRFAPASAARKLVVARRLLQEALERGLLLSNPAHRLEGIETAQETPHTALEPAQARLLLEAVDRSSKQGQRDYDLTPV